MSGHDVIAEALRHERDLSRIEEELNDDDAVVVRKVAPGRSRYMTKPVVGAEPGELPPLEEESRSHLEGLVPAGRAAVQKLRRDGADADVDADERAALEAIVLLMARPAILVQDGRFFPAPQPWTEELEQHRSAIEDVLPRVGRIEVEGHPAIDWVGTGWLAAADVVMTNRHVAAEFARNDGRAWAFAPGVTGRVDYNEELSASQPRELRLTEVIGVHDTVDLALLRCASDGSAGVPQLDPLRIARDPAVRGGTKVYVVGYPAADSRRNDPEEMQRIFAGIYNVKRLQPGAVQSASETVVHDCSTLGGNSGSCLLDLETSMVIGLHFGGRYLQGNQAVPLWRLADDPLLQRAGVEFS
ncbi:serine protease [Saccharopolyspora sp. K220]|uniref:trypsin-like serine peptidase n=1 Tax=Saccharopolyspora soli TaxID=2926618 RepID=UPI001F55B53D|nr:serine protease [Saccharopolyspora soli]MCI2421579.1 serine protease [Saccharopolyspora soli]